MAPEERAGPLEGVVVLDCTQVMAGPFCTLLLADMGADVIKVERPQGGDETRRMGPFYADGWSAPFTLINRNKRSLALDLRHPRGREVFLRLARRADVVVENFRPGTLARLGVGYSQVRQVRPEVVYCSISGFGQTGPYASRGGFDLVAQGMSGLMSVTGHPNTPPAKVGVPIADLNAGLFAAYGILAAYVHRLRTGQGQHVDTSLLEGAMAYLFWEAAVYFATGQVPGPLGSAHRLTAPYQAFRTRDGYLVLGAANQATWERLCRLLGREELLEDPRFRTAADRKRHERELEGELEAAFAARTTAEWVDALTEAEVPAGPVYDLAQALADPHVQARGMAAQVEVPGLGPVRQLGLPVKLSATLGRIRRPAPRLGQHTDEVLAWGRFSPEEVAALRREGVVA